MKGDGKFASPPVALRINELPATGAGVVPKVNAAPWSTPMSATGLFQIATPGRTLSLAEFVSSLMAAAPNSTTWDQFVPSVVALARLKSSSTGRSGSWPVGPLKTWNVRPLTVLRPLLARTASWCGPDKVPVGTDTAISRSFHVVVGRAAPSRVTWPAPLVGPKPWPVMVNDCAPMARSAYGLETVHSSGVVGGASVTFSVHRTAWFCWDPGSWMLTAIWVGALSDGMMSPGIASNSAAIVRN